LFKTNRLNLLITEDKGSEGAKAIAGGHPKQRRHGGHPLHGQPPGAALRPLAPVLKGRIVAFLVPL